MRYLSVDEVIALHDAEEEPGVLDAHMLASAVEQPQVSAGGQDAYPTIHDKAAALLRGLACNHGFVDGNKRTALLAVFQFYGWNGHYLRADHAELLHLILDVATGEITDIAKIADRLSMWAYLIADLVPDEE